MTRTHQHRVVITGYGTVSALGSDWESIKSRLQAGTNAVRHMHEWEVYPDLQNLIAAPIDDFTLPAHFRARERRSLC